MKLQSLFEYCQICRKRRWEFIIILLILNVIAYGCNPSGKTGMRFSNVVKSAPHGDAPGEPLFSAITSIEDWEKVEDQIPEEVFSLGMDAYRQNPGQLYLVAYAGIQPSSGYSIEITEVTREKDQITVIVSSKSPDPEEIVQPSTTGPYHIVSLKSKDNDRWSGYTVTFKDENGHVLKNMVLS